MNCRNGGDWHTGERSWGRHRVRPVTRLDGVHDQRTRPFHVFEGGSNTSDRLRIRAGIRTRCSSPRHVGISCACRRAKATREWLSASSLVCCSRRISCSSRSRCRRTCRRPAGGCGTSVDDVGRCRRSGLRRWHTPFVCAHARDAAGAVRASGGADSRRVEPAQAAATGAIAMDGSGAPVDCMGHQMTGLGCMFAALGAFSVHD